MTKNGIIIIAIAAFLAGCSMLDLDGSGKFDPIAYIESVDVIIAWTGEDGAVYNVALDEFGKRLAGQFIQAKTGYLFEVAEGGGITITDQAGVQLRIKPKE